MEQAIPAAVGKLEDTVFKPANMMNMVDVANSAKKGENTKSIKDEKDPKSLVPFLQLLNQQMAQLFQPEKNIDFKMSIDGKTVSPDQINQEAIQGNQNNNILGLMLESTNVGDEMGREILSLAKFMAFMEGGAKEANAGLMLEAKNVSNGMEKGILSLAKLLVSKESGTKEASAGLSFNEAVPGKQNIKVPGLLSKEEVLSLAKLMASMEGGMQEANAGLSFDEAVQENENVEFSGLLPEAAKNSNVTKEEILNLARALMDNKTKGRSPDGDKEITVISKDKKQTVTKLEDENTEVLENNTLKQYPDKIPTIITGNANVEVTKKENLLSEQELQRSKIFSSDINETKQEKGKNRILNKDNVKEIRGKDITLENSAVESGGNKIVNSDDFKNHSNIFNNSEENSNGEGNIKIRENISFAANDPKKHIFVTNNQNTEFQQAQTKTENINFAKVEAVQALWTDVNEKLKTDQKNKIVHPENLNEEISINYQNTTGGTTAKAGNVTLVSPAEIINQVANEIKENTITDGGRIKIVLNPPSLGTLEMEVLVYNNKVEVTLTANSKDVQQILNGNLEQLKSTLQNQGLTVERCDVMMSNRQDDFYRSFGNASYFQQRPHREGRDEQTANNDEKISSMTSAEKTNRSTMNVGMETDSISLFV
jgi:flagellar hook-length control protein FliK